MLSLLTNWKSYLIIALLLSLLANMLQYNANLRLDNKLITLQASVNLANKMRDDLEKKLQVREREAANEQAETQKLMEQLNKDEIPDDCNQAIQTGIGLIHPLKFNRENNIP